MSLQKMFTHSTELSGICWWEIDCEYIRPKLPLTLKRCPRFRNIFSYAWKNRVRCNFFYWDELPFESTHNIYIWRNEICICNGCFQSNSSIVFQGSIDFKMTIIWILFLFYLFYWNYLQICVLYLFFFNILYCSVYFSTQKSL